MMSYVLDQFRNSQIAVITKLLAYWKISFLLAKSMLDSAIYELDLMKTMIRSCFMNLIKTFNLRIFSQV